ncbi:hypothetical protein [Xenorhabdus bharatensis]|uniref:hypothetical protein n=1 Tax=Xenorhabdus bharatensis TaxID=3136256 RepID=UPI0030F4A069
MLNENAMIDPTKNIVLDATETITVISNTGAEFPSNKATFITSQTLQLNITVSGTATFKKHDILTVHPEDGWMSIQGTPATSINLNTFKSATCIINATISSDTSFVGKTKKLTISTSNSNYPPKDLQYFVSDINNNSLSINLDKFHIEVPDQDNEPSIGNTIRVLASTIVKDKNNTGVIPNLPISITVGDQSTLSSKVKLMTYTGKKITPQANPFSGIQYFNLTTDASGNLRFYVFPQQKESTLLKLQSQIISGDLQPPKQPLFILDSKNAQFRAHPAPPDILQLSGGTLSPIKNETSFSIKIPEYPNPSPTDYILFILNGVILENYTQVSNINNLGTYHYQLPYSMLQMSDEANSFGYILAIGDLNILYSDKISFKYEWGSKGPGDKERTLHLPTIYSSYGVEKSNILPMNYIIDFTTLSQYIFTGAALFVEIEADSNAVDKVKPGDTVTVEVIVESSNRGPIHQPYTLTLPAAAHGQTTSKGTVKIPYALVGNLGADNEDGGSTILYIDYYKGPSKKTGVYSKKWQAFIDSRMAGG